MLCRYVLLFLLAVTLGAQELPEGPGRAEVQKWCKPCHEIARSISPRQDRDGWNHTLTRMVAFGMKVNDKDYALLLDYLVKNYPAEEVPKINVNTATAIQLESALSLKRSQAAALIAYRTQNGGFKTLEDLKKVPQIDAEKIDAKKDRITF